MDLVHLGWNVYLISKITTHQYSYSEKLVNEMNTRRIMFASPCKEIAREKSIKYAASKLNNIVDNNNKIWNIKSYAPVGLDEMICLKQKTKQNKTDKLVAEIF